MKTLLSQIWVCLFWWFRKYSCEGLNYRCSNETCETCTICMALINMPTGSNVVSSWFGTSAAKQLLHVLCLFPQTIHHKVFCIILRCIQGILATDFAWLDHWGKQSQHHPVVRLQLWIMGSILHSINVRAPGVQDYPFKHNFVRNPGVHNPKNEEMFFFAFRGGVCKGLVSCFVF